MVLEPVQHSIGEQIATDVRNTADTLEFQKWSAGSTERAYSPASDRQSDASLRDEELRQALDRTTAAESKAAMLQEERNQQEGVLLQLMDDIGTLQSQLDELQAAKIQRVWGVSPYHRGVPQCRTAADDDLSLIHI